MIFVFAIAFVVVWGILIYNTKQSTPFIGATAPHGRG